MERSEAASQRIGEKYREYETVFHSERTSNFLFLLCNRCVEDHRIVEFFLFTFHKQIDRIYREHKEYLQIIINQMSFAKNQHETDELINRIDRYISDHESRQLELLKDLAILSKNVSELFFVQFCFRFHFKNLH